MKNTLAIVTAVALSACSTQTFLINGDTTAAPTKDEPMHFFVNGIGQQRTFDAAEVCGGADKVVKVEVQETFLNGLLRAVTYGIYAPREARVYCR